MACVISRAENPNGGSEKITVHWHELLTQMMLEIGTGEPSIAIMWQPDSDTGVQTHLSVEEAAALAEALITALERLAEFTNGIGSIPDWLPPDFGQTEWPQAGEF